MWSDHKIELRLKCVMLTLKRQTCADGGFTSLFTTNVPFFMSTKKRGNLGFSKSSLWNNFFLNNLKKKPIFVA